MKIDAKGNIVDHQIAESVINVDRRMSYTNVKKIITLKDPEKKAEYKILYRCLNMKEVGNFLREKRRNVVPLTLIFRRQSNSG